MKCSEGIDWDDEVGLLLYSVDGLALPRLGVEVEFAAEIATAMNAIRCGGVVGSVVMRHALFRLGLADFSGGFGDAELTERGAKWLYRWMAQYRWVGQ
jgi:hypothetical protein